MSERNSRHNRRLSLARAVAWFRRLSGWGKVDLFGAVSVWAVVIVILIDRTLTDGTLMGFSWALAISCAALGIGAGWRVIKRIRQPEDDPGEAPEPGERLRVYSLVAAWLIVPLILAGVGGWVAFEMTAGAVLDNRRFWSGLTFVCIFMVGDLVPAVWLVVRARRADRAAEKIVARVAKMKSDRRR